MTIKKLILEKIYLRDVRTSDLDTFFNHQMDPEAVHMAAFTAKDPTDRQAFDRHWQKIMADQQVSMKTITHRDIVLGYILKYEQDGRSEISYWIGKSYWGQGVATRALILFLKLITDRPLFARAASDNYASIRVLEKCGFSIIAEELGFANARQQKIKEYLLELSTDGQTIS